MGYRTLKDCVYDLERTKQLVRIEEEIDPRLEAAEIQRRVYAAQGPALLFTRVKGCAFPMVSNLFGTLPRCRFLFRDTIETVRRLIELKISPEAFRRNPLRFWKVPRAALTMLPRKVRHGPVLAHKTTLRCLPQLTSWPEDGGAFITLPLVYTEHPDAPGWRSSNLGMYRIQISGNQYEPDSQAGMHYQIHRGIGVHHAAALRRGESLKVNIHIGGPPALILSAVMPLPEGLPELTFAGALGGRRVDLVAQPNSLPILAEADFCITGTIDPRLTLPEGPFGDHLGYYARIHDFPVVTVDHVSHRPGAIWPFTVVGRPPQEDTTFGQIIHELTGPVIPSVLPGVHAVHAVDAAGVHPLLLAIGSERYVPYAPVRKPQELLTCAHAILGQGQLSLAKYLFIVAKEDQPELDIHDIGAFLRHLLERVDWSENLHFITRTTIDTLDYSGTGLNEGSKLIVTVAGPERRRLLSTVGGIETLPEGFSSVRLALPGVLAIKGPAYAVEGESALWRFSEYFNAEQAINQYPLIVLVDDAEFAARNLRNFLWVTFTRSNPAADVGGIGHFTQQKHWGCRGSLVIDARMKPQHAPPLVEDPQVSRRVDALALPGRPLHGII